MRAAAPEGYEFFNNGGMPDAPPSRGAPEILEVAPGHFVSCSRHPQGRGNRAAERDWMELTDALEDIRTLCPTIASVTMDTHSAGLERAQRYWLSMFDGLVVAAALEAGCATLWSEDMHHGLVIDERLKILNPFIEDVPGSP